MKLLNTLSAIFIALSLVGCDSKEYSSSNDYKDYSGSSGTSPASTPETKICDAPAMEKAEEQLKESGFAFKVDTKYDGSNLNAFRDRYFTVEVTLFKIDDRLLDKVLNKQEQLAAMDEFTKAYAEKGKDCESHYYASKAELASKHSAKLWYEIEKPVIDSEVSLLAETGLEFSTKSGDWNMTELNRDKLKSSKVTDTKNRLGHFISVMEPTATNPHMRHSDNKSKQSELDEKVKLAKSLLPLIESEKDVWRAIEKDYVTRSEAGLNRAENDLNKVGIVFVQSGNDLNIDGDVLKKHARDSVSEQSGAQRRAALAGALEIYSNRALAFLKIAESGVLESVPPVQIKSVKQKQETVFELLRSIRREQADLREGAFDVSEESLRLLRKLQGRY